MATRPLTLAASLRRLGGSVRRVETGQEGPIWRGTRGNGHAYSEAPKMNMRPLGLAAVLISLTACSSGASPSAPASAPASVAASASTAEVSASPSPTPAPSPVKVNVLLDFSLDGTMAALLYGIDQGYFKDEAIDLTVTPSTGSNVALPEIDSKKVDFAFINMSSIIQDNVQNKASLVGVTTWENYSSFAIVSLKPINSLSDLVGKNFGTVAFSSGRQNFPLVLQANGVDPSKVPIKLLDFSVLYQALFNGQIDTAETGLPGSGDTLRVQAQKLGKTVYMYPFSKWGFVDYNKVLVTRKDVIDSNADLVARMVRATNKSMAQGLANLTSDDVATIMTKANPQSDPAASKALWDDFKMLTKDSGPFDPTTVATIFQRTVTQGKLSTTAQPTDFYTNQFQTGG
jgi:NitT/TauT family transport system substrate-binding protein